MATAAPESSAFEPLAYTVKQVLDRVPISRSHLYGEITAGRLVATKIGDRTIFLAGDVDDWLNTGRRA